MNPSISVIIPCKNEEKDLKYLLEDIKSQSIQPVDIIVSDANSTDNTVRIAEQYGAKIVNGGLPSVGRNNGARAATGDILIFIDADVQIKDNLFFEKIIFSFTQRKYDCATTMRLPHFEGIQISPIKRKLITIGYMLSNHILLYWSKGSNPRAVGDAMIIKKNVFFECGGFSQRAYWGEDSELAVRLINKGYKFTCLQNKIYCSARKIIKHGLLSSVQNVMLLDRARVRYGFVTRSEFNRITKIADYFEK
jgi:glycosyltransferase involved in cell wall biosynthesis